MDGWWTFNNDGGTIDVQKGTLEFSCNSILNGGNYNIAAGSLFNLKSATHIFKGTLIGSPAGVFSLNGGTISTDSATVTLDIKGNGFQFVYGTVTGGGTLEIPNGALLVLPGVNYASLRGGTTLLNQGTVRQEGTNGLGIQGLSVVDNRRIWIITSDADYSGGTGSGGTFINTGTFRKSGGTDVSTMNGWWSFTNKAGGIIQVDSGTVDISNLENEQDAIIKGTGSIDVPSNFTNNGINSPGNSPGMLSYIGNYLPSSTGVLDIQLGGLQNSEYDRLNITGTAKLNGTLKVSLVDNFIPAAGDSFVVLTTTGAITDSFPTIDAQSGLYLTIKKNTNNVTIFVDSVGTIVSVDDDKKTEIVTSYNLSQNYPNPFNPEAPIKYDIPSVGTAANLLFC